MRVQGELYRTLCFDAAAEAVRIIDQTRLPHHFEQVALRTLPDFERAISEMQVRGAPLIGATAAYGLALALRDDPSPAREEEAAARLAATRPTAVNLAWALARVRSRIAALPSAERADAALAEAEAICDEDIAICEAIGEYGLALLREVAQSRGSEPLQVMTHCNAGWLATIDWGTALASVYKAHAAGLPVHVWVAETRPRNQGTALTAWELAAAEVPHTLVVDNAAGHLMQQGRVDLCIVGSDRTTRSGDVCNKIGTYLKAVAARDNGVPFYVALPTPTIDWTLQDGHRDIPIEERSPSEVLEVSGLRDCGAIETLRLAPATTTAANFAFDVTPARLVTGLITEYGIVEASEPALAALRARIPG